MLLESENIGITIGGHIGVPTSVDQNPAAKLIIGLFYNSLKEKLAKFYCKQFKKNTVAKFV